MNRRIRFPIGLGDALAMSALPVYYLTKGWRAVFPYDPINEVSIKDLFKDLEVELIPIKAALKEIADYTAQLNLKDPYQIVIPKKYCRVFTYLDEDKFEESGMDIFRYIYAEREVPYGVKWDYCPIQKFHVEQIRVPKGPYCFRHDDAKRGMVITKGQTRLPVYRPDPSKSILAHIEIVEQAAVLEVLDSAIFHLAELTEPTGDLFLHRYPRPYTPVRNDYWTRHKWIDVW